MVKKLLVVDDEPSFGKLVSTIASKHGLDVRIAQSGAEFQKLFKEFLPDIAVIDIVMPELDGFELADWLGKQKHTCALIFITGNRPDYVRQAAILAETAGLKVLATLHKPLDVKELITAIEASEG